MGRGLKTLVLVGLLSGCNVFLGLDSVEPGDNAQTNAATNADLQCTTDCTCNMDCDIACGDACEVICAQGRTCTGNVPDGSKVICDRDSSCDVSCTGGNCSFDCDSRADCAVDCPDGAACVLECGFRFGSDGCGFSNCANEESCSGGSKVCNRECP